MNILETANNYNWKLITYFIYNATFLTLLLITIELSDTTTTYSTMTNTVLHRYISEYLSIIRGNKQNIMLTSKNIFHFPKSENYYILWTLSIANSQLIFSNFQKCFNLDFRKQLA